MAASQSSFVRSKAMWIGLLLSLGAVGLLLWRVSFRDLGAALHTANLIWLVPCLFVLLAMFVMRSWRWALLLGGTRFVPTWHANMIGYMFNITFPLRLGEIARAYVIAKQEKISLARALSAVLVERLIDLSAVVLMFAAFALRIPMRPSFTRAALLGSGVVVLSVLGGVLVVAMGDKVERFLRPRLEARAGKERAETWLARFRDIREGFRSVGSAKRMAQCLTLTVLIWAATIFLAALCLLAFDPGPMDIGRPGLVVVMANLGGALPSAPGGLGILQGFATSALVVPFGVPEGQALAYVLVWSLSQQLVLVVLGLVSLGRVGLSVGEIRARATAGGGQMSEPAGSAESS